MVPLLIAFGAFFVAAEYAYVSIRPVQLKTLAKRRRRTAAALTSLKSQPAATIAALQIGITVVGLLLGIIGEPELAALITYPFHFLEKYDPHLFHIISSVVAIGLVTFLTTIFSELLPKALTLRYAPIAAVITAVPTYYFLVVMRPFVWAMNRTADLVTVPLGLGRVEEMEASHSHSAEEIRFMAREAGEKGELSNQERALVLNSLSLGRRHARQIMIPRVRVAYLDLQKSMDANRAVMNEHLYSRLPLCDGGMDNVVGVVPTKEFLSALYAEGDSSVLNLIARPAVFAPETIALDQLLILFDQKKSQLIFIVDEHGGVEGIVTLRDVVDELVGEPMEQHVPADHADGRLVLPGDAPLHEIREQLNLPHFAEAESVITIAGLISRHLGRIARPGEQVTVEGVHIKVLESDSRAVRKVALTAPEKTPSPSVDEITEDDG